MPRDLPLGNGRLLVAFDHGYTLRDLYWPHVGQENHVRGARCRFGAWVEGRLAWVDEDGWERRLEYEPETLVTHVVARHPGLGLELTCADVVDLDRDLLLRRVDVRDLAGRGEREVRLFWHHDLDMGGTEEGNTAYYAPELAALIHYRGPNWLLLNLQVDGHGGVGHYATGSTRHFGREGTWRDAEDGLLSRNSIAQGCVDSVIAAHVTVREGGRSGGQRPAETPASRGAIPREVLGGTSVPGRAYLWAAIGSNYEAVASLDALVRERGPEFFFARTRAFWSTWVNKEETPISQLGQPISALYKRSLLIIRTQVDHGGAILAANDSDVLNYNRDTYSYMWPRDGALVAEALDRAGQPYLSRLFYRFCAGVVTPQGYLLHKYNPDRSVGSSWHPWTDAEGQPTLPIQEDETALTLHALWQHFRCYRDLEFVRDLYAPFIRPAGEFLYTYRDEEGLPKPSYDLWEERHGVHAFTVGSVWAGLQAAASFAELFGSDERARRLRNAALQMRRRAREMFFHPELGRYVRRLYRTNGTWIADPVPDSSLAGLFLFGMLGPRDEAMATTMAAVEQELWCRDGIGGLARYAHDDYHRICAPAPGVAGNPWMICTLWLANWYLERGRWPEDLERVQDLLLWVVDRALPSGVLAEQVHPKTGAPLSVSPLTWSHAEFVGTVHRFLDCLRRLQVGKGAARPNAMSPKNRLVVTGNGAASGGKRKPGDDVKVGSEMTATEALVPDCSPLEGGQAVSPSDRD
jgi:GH15 family glucan-1,4-alpha-glucosidase